MAELVDAHVSGACAREGVRVRLPLSALVKAFLTGMPFFVLEGTKGGEGTKAR